MTLPLALDAANGRIEAFGAVIDADSRADDVPPLFLKTWQMVNVEGRQVECVFATAGGTATDRSAVELTLRFEHEQLASAFITLTPHRHRNLDSEAFYASADERYRFHERWLASAGVPRQPATFSWGETGVARDRSENVHIYLHWTPRLMPGESGDGK
jgi:hypothetical protein